MKAALFIPCYVDAFFPEVGIATLELLERLGVEVDYPLEQTCCGQPMANSGCHDDAAATEALFVQNFSGYDYIVTPSGSCAHHVREHLTAIPQSDETLKVRGSTYELVEFLHDVLKVREFPWAKFPHAVGLHNGCASLRALRTAKMSEIDEPFFRSRSLCCRTSKVSASSRLNGLTSVVDSAARSQSSRNRCRPKWDTTRLLTINVPAPSTSCQPTCRA